MKRASLAISTLVAVISTLIFQSHILGALNQIATRIQSSYNSYTEPAASRPDTAEIPPIKETQGEEQLIFDDMSIPRAIRKVFLAVEQAEAS